MDKRKRYEILIIAYFLIVISGIFVADRILVKIEAGKMPEVFADHDYLDHPYKKNFKYVRNFVGGDLTDSRTARRYGSHHHYDIITDAYGFMPPRGATPANSDVVVIGDSFTQGPTNELTVPGMISGRNGHVAYNMGYPGYPYNCALSFDKYFQPNPSAAAPKKTLVFMLCKRSLTGDFADLLAYRLNLSPGKLRKKKMQRAASGYFPNNIVRLFKDHSVIVKMLTPLFLPVNKFMGSEQPANNVVIGKNGVLYLNIEVNYMKEYVGADSVVKFTGAMQLMNGHAAARGFKLLLVLVPDKSDVYPQFLPDNYRKQAGDPVGVHFDKIADASGKAGIEVINLLPEMRARAAEHAGLFYFRNDDSHWNENGMKLAADRITERIGEK